MKTMIAVLAALGAVTSAPAMAQSNQAQPAAKAPMAAMPAMKDAPPTHEMCKAVMGSNMDPKAVHDHGRDKTGAPTWPNGKPPSKAEMDRMHKACSEMMGQTMPAAPQPAPKP